MKIRLERVTENNREQVQRLEVKNEQKSFIETVVDCLKEADESSLWYPIAIYADEELAGFAMIGYFSDEGESGRAWLDRFLIDQHFQGRGIAMAALSALIKKMEEKYQCREIYLSIINGNQLAVSIYEKMGFRFTGELDKNRERIMKLIL